MVRQIAVSHSKIIQTLVCLSKETKSQSASSNGSALPAVEYEDGKLTVKGVGDSSYCEVAKSLQETYS